MPRTQFLTNPLRIFSADQQSQKAIEADEVIDMRMRDKDELEPLHFAWRERRDIAEIEEDGALLEQRFDVKRGIAASPVDEARMQQRPHARRQSIRRAGPGRNELLAL